MIDSKNIDKLNSELFDLFGYTFNQNQNILFEYESNKRGNKMATRLIKQSDLEKLFPDETQRKAFLDIMSGLIMVEPKAIVVDIVDAGPIIIKRHGKWIYED